MTSRRVLLALALGLLVVPTAAMANPIFGSVGAGWQTAATPSESQAQYWDGDSWDSHSVPPGTSPCSAGSLFMGIPCDYNGLYQLPAKTNVEFWGNNDGSADTSITFGRNGAFNLTLTFFGEFTANRSYNEFGYYMIGDPSQRFTLFSASQGDGAQVATSITGEFGFYFHHTASNYTFYTDSSLNTWGPGTQQFAVFRSGSQFFLGVEDLFGPGCPACSDYDFNDLMLSFELQPVPEPATLTLLGLGMAGAGAERWRRRRQAARRG